MPRFRGAAPTAQGHTTVVQGPNDFDFVLTYVHVGATFYQGSFLELKGIFFNRALQREFAT